jgi:hypothetical protein
MSANDPGEGARLLRGAAPPPAAAAEPAQRTTDPDAMAWPRAEGAGSMASQQRRTQRAILSAAAAFCAAGLAVLLLVGSGTYRVLEDELEDSLGNAVPGQGRYPRIRFS